MRTHPGRRHFTIRRPPGRGDGGKPRPACRLERAMRGHAPSPEAVGPRWCASPSHTRVGRTTDAPLPAWPESGQPLQASAPPASVVSDGAGQSDSSTTGPRTAPSRRRRVRGERLPMSRGRNAALVRKPRQEALDFHAPQRSWMPQTVEPNVRANPMDMSPLGSYAVVKIPDALAQLVENLDRTQWRQVVGEVFIACWYCFFVQRRS